MKTSIKYIVSLIITSSLVFGASLYAQTKSKDFMPELESQMEYYNETWTAHPHEVLQFHKGPVTFPAEDPATHAKLMRIAAFDVGSTGVRLKLVDVDPVKKEIIN